MKIKLSIISTIFIIIIINFSVYANENIYKNDYFDFSIKTNDKWPSPTDDEIYDFSSNKQMAKLTLVTSNNGYIIVNISEPNLTLSSLSIYDQSSSLREQILDFPGYFNVTTIKKTSLNDIPFCYFTFDIKVDGVIHGKSYIYNTMIGQNTYRLLIANVNDNNKPELIKVLKSIEIEQ